MGNSKKPSGWLEFFGMKGWDSFKLLSQPLITSVD